MGQPSARALLLALGLLLLGVVGCVVEPEPSPAYTLHQRFPDQAAQVLQTAGAFTALEGGFAPATGGDIVGMLARRGGLQVALPQGSEGPIRFHIPGGFEARVTEKGASGSGAIAERAVAYEHKGSTSFWAATDQGYEEWLLLEAGIGAGVPVATWEVEGAVMRQSGEVVELVDEAGVARLRVTAPDAYTARGKKIGAKLAVRGSTLELSLAEDARGQAVLVDPSWSLTTSMSTVRENHAVALLQNGTVLVMGGSIHGSPSSYLSSVELYDRSASPPTWTTKASMHSSRGYHTATTLADGTVLVTGGIGGSGPGTVSSAELYDPTTNVWTTKASMHAARAFHTATLLPNGDVLTTGGSGLSSAEYYVPGTDTWNATGSMAGTRLQHTAVLFSSAGGPQILVAGGMGVAGFTTLSSAELYDVTAGTWSSTSSMSAARYSHTATFLTLTGDILIAGGEATGGVYLSAAELYNPTAGTWSSAAPMSVPRFGHTATPLGLSGGEVLVAGGMGDSDNGNSTAEFYSPSEDTWTSAGSMSAARAYHTATMLGSGEVLLAGGTDGVPTISTAELFFQSGSHAWTTTTSSMAGVRYAHTATQFAPGKVLVAGGLDPSGHLSSAQIYDSTVGWVSPSPPSMSVVRTGHTATLLGNGSVLVVGGTDGATYYSSAELYNPGTATWTSAGGMPIGRAYHTATMLSSGEVLIAGGRTSSTYFSTAEVYNPNVTPPTWSPAGAMNATRSEATATLLNDGTVLIAGGGAASAELSSAELYNPMTDAFTLTGAMSGCRREHTATLLPNGSVLVAGGYCSGFGYLSHAEVFFGGVWTDVMTMNGARGVHTATLLKNGTVLVAGGYNGGSTVSTAEIFDTMYLAWLPVTPMNAARQQFTSTLFADGTVLAVGGAAFGALSSSEYFTP